MNTNLRDELYPFQRSAGEWELAMSGRLVASEASFPVAWLTSATAAFMAAFEWVEVQSALIGLPDASEYATWDSSAAPLVEWLEALPHPEATGAELTLDLLLHHSDPSGALVSQRFPDAGKLLLSLNTHGILSAIVTIWPNVFTDTIYRYSGDRSATLQRQLVPFQAAAQANRSVLAAALQHWEQASQGTIVLWESELIDGVERYGVADSATPHV